MADVQKPTDVPATAPVTTEPVVPETAPADTTAAAPVADTPAADETKAEDTPAAAATEPAPADEPKKEVKPIEEGSLKHKAAPASFPENFIYAKNHFWFGSDATPKEKLSHFKTDKATDVAHYVIAWAGETGKGLLFYGKDAKAPTGAIPLAEATEPTVDGPTKFIVHAKGHKHTFKSVSTAERDNWVSQLKLKIAEAKELAATVTESEGFKKTLESFKPAPVVKKEATPAPVAAAAAPADAPAAPEAASAEAPKVEDAKPAEAKEEKKEETKQRSSSKKRNSLFGGLSFGGKKEEAKKEEKPAATTEETAAAEPAADAAPAVVEPVVPVETPEAPAAEAATDAPAAEATTAEVKPAEAAKETKPTPTKRSSIFGNLSFGKKKADGEAAPVTPTKDAAPAVETAPIAETAPVIPPVETNAPLSTEVTSPATVPTDTTDATPATNGEAKKEVKSDKRKSSLPFAFGKKEKSPTSDEEGEKGEKKSSGFSFGKLRQTVKGKKSEKVAEKPAETTAEPATDDKPAEPAAPEVEPAKPAEATPAVEETPAEPTAPATATPTVSAAA